jgi:hypothetical protein
MPTLIQLIAKNPSVNAFPRVGGEGDDPNGWNYEPMPGDVVAEDDWDAFYIVAALGIKSRGDVRKCHMDVCLQERIND